MKLSHDKTNYFLNAIIILVIYIAFGLCSFMGIFAEEHSCLISVNILSRLRFVLIILFGVNLMMNYSSIKECLERNVLRSILTILVFAGIALAIIMFTTKNMKTSIPNEYYWDFRSWITYCVLIVPVTLVTITCRK